MSSNRIRWAFMLAPLVPALYLLVVGVASQSPVAYPELLILALVLAISYLSCFLFGIPLLQILRTREALQAPSFIGIASLLGVVVNLGATFLVGVLLDTKGQVLQLDVVLWGLIFGAMVSVPFAAIAGIPLTSRPRKHR